MDRHYGIAQEASVLAAEARETARDNWDQLSARLQGSYDRYAAPPAAVACANPGDTCRRPDCRDNGCGIARWEE